MEQKDSSTSNNGTPNQEENTQEGTNESSEGQLETFKDILNDEDLEELRKKHRLENCRNRKLPIHNFFWLIVLSAGDPSRRGSLANMIAFFLGAIATLTTISVNSISKSAVSKRLSKTNWYFFRGVYNH
jgi:Zn-dependent M16 (insulinase) family peptidase